MQAEFDYKNHKSQTLKALVDGMIEFCDNGDEDCSGELWRAAAELAGLAKVCAGRRAACSRGAASSRGSLAVEVIAQRLQTRAGGLVATWLGGADRVSHAQDGGQHSADPGVKDEGHCDRPAAFTTGQVVGGPMVASGCQGPQRVQSRPLEAIREVKGEWRVILRPSFP